MLSSVTAHFSTCRTVEQLKQWLKNQQRNHSLVSSKIIVERNIPPDVEHVNLENTNVGEVAKIVRAAFTLRPRNDVYGEHSFSRLHFIRKIKRQHEFLLPWFHAVTTVDTIHYVKLLITVYLHIRHGPCVSAECVNYRKMSVEKVRCNSAKNLISKIRRCHRRTVLAKHLTTTKTRRLCDGVKLI